MSDRLGCATNFEIMPEFYPAYGRCAGGVAIDKREQMDGSVKWAVTWGGNTLNRSGNWSYERQPSSRTDAYLRSNRFDTLDEAWEAAIKASRRMLKRIVKEYGLAPYRRHNGDAVPFPVLPD